MRDAGRARRRAHQAGGEDGEHGAQAADDEPAEALRERGHDCLILISRKQVDARLGARYPALRFAAMPGAGLGSNPVAFARFVGSQVRALAFCRGIFRREPPDAVVGFGGFTSAPALLISRFRGVPGALHEVIMEADDKRAVFLDEFDAMADYVSPIPDLPTVADPAARTEDVTEETPSVA